MSGTVESFDKETGAHEIKYDDDTEEELDLLALDKQRPAWEFEPFTKKYFGF